MKKVYKSILLFLAGGGIYTFIEVVYRYLLGKQDTHWTMFILGGISFALIGELNEHTKKEIPFLIQDIIGTIIVLVLEFIFGCVLNLWLGLEIWDYSNLPFNLLGQVCLPFAAIWFLLVAVAIVLDDELRYLWFGEKKPKYYFKNIAKRN